jgi:hypothetical protein
LSSLGWFWPSIFYWIFVSIIQFHSLELEPISPNRCPFKSQKPQLEPVGLTLQRGNLPPLLLTFGHLILVWHTFLEFSYKPHPGIKSNIDFRLVHGKSTPDIEIGINLVQRLVLP